MYRLKRGSTEGDLDPAKLAEIFEANETEVVASEDHLDYPYHVDLGSHIDGPGQE